MIIFRSSLWRTCRAVAGLLALLGLDGPAAWGTDHGDSPAAATAVTPGGPAVSGLINPDVDQDWFSFVALPSVQYAITNRDQTVWNTELALIAPDGRTGLYLTNTAAAGSPASIRWTNTGAIATCYVRVRGLVEYTTGTYSIAVGRLNWQDSDGDGLPNWWETQYFGCATCAVASADSNSNGVSNLDMYYLNAHPTDPSSGLQVTKIWTASGGTSVRWPAARYGTYRVQAAASPSNGAVWSVLGTTINMEGLPLLEMLDADATSHSSRFYRVQFAW